MKQTRRPRAIFKKIYDMHRKGYRQKHLCLCGPSSIALGAHALGLELKDERDFLHRKFQRWIPNHEFTQQGMALHEALFMAEMLYEGRIEAHLNRAYPENFSNFQEAMRSAARGQCALILNFTQDHLFGLIFEDHGNPHYSLPCGFNPRTKEVFIADVDPEVEKAYPVTLKRLFEAMSFTNPTIGLPRGWITLRRRG